MILRRLLVYPPLSTILAHAFNDPNIERNHTEWVTNHNPDKDTMRNPFAKPTQEAEDAARNLSAALSGIYCQAIGNRVDIPRLTPAMAVRIARAVDKDNDDTWPDES